MPAVRRLVALLALAAPAALAQAPAGPVPTALPFLDLTPSPALLGLGGAGVAQPAADAHLALANPALLGLAARDLSAATAAGPGAADWRGYGDIDLGGVAQMAGTGVSVRGLPLTVGASYARATMGYGESAIAGTEATYEPTDRYQALSLGAATTGAVRVALGATGRYVTSTDRAILSDGHPKVYQLHGLTADVGAAVSADVAALLGRPAFALPLVGRLRPALDLTAGYAQTHVGGRIRYSGGDWLPLPRTARLGWGAVVGLDAPLGRAGTLRPVEAELALMAESRLVREDTDGVYTFDPLVGDLGPLDALFGRGDALVTGRRGVRVMAFETVSVSWGYFGGGGYENARAHAVELRLAGPLKVAAALSGSDALAAAARRFDLRWTRAVTFVGTPYETAMSGFALVVRR
jgi:hypothetical protein